MYCKLNAFIDGKKKNPEAWTSKLVNDLPKVTELIRGKLGSSQKLKVRVPFTLAPLLITQSLMDLGNPSFLQHFARK